MAKRLDPATWAQIRARYAAGASFGIIAAEFSISKGTVGERAKAEGWTRSASNDPNDPNGKPNAPNGRRSGEGKAKRKASKLGGDALRAPPPEEPESLEGRTLKQRRFVREYLIDGNATRAAKAAGYSEGSAGQLGYQLLQIPAIAAAITEAERLRAERTNITADRVRLELARMGLADLSDLAEWDAGAVRLRSSSELPPDLSAAVVEVSEGKEGVKIKLGKMQALRELAKATGLTAQRQIGGGGADPVTKVERTVVRPPDPHG